MIGLLNKAATLSAAEFSAIGSLQGSALDNKQKVLVSQLGDTFVKVDEILAKFADTVLLGNVDNNGAAFDFTVKLNEAFVKIDVLAAGMGDGSAALLPAVQKVYEAAFGSKDPAGGHTPGLLDFIAGLSGSPALASVSSDDLQKVIKLSDGFIALDGIVMKAVEDSVVSDKIAPDNIKGHIADIFVKMDGLIGSINDTGLKTSLGDFETQFQGEIIAVLNPQPGGGGDFTGGVTVAGGTLT